MDQLGDMVLVKYQDVTTHSGWHPAESRAKLGTAINCTVGFLLERTKQRLVIAHTISDSGEIADVTIILASLVRGVTKMKAVGKVKL